MGDPKKMTGRAFARMIRSLEEDVLRDDYPKELIDEELREAGGDPDEIGRRGAELVKKLLDVQRAKWRDEAIAGTSPILARHDAARARPRASREHMLRRIRRAEADPRYAGQVALAFRGRRPDEPTDDELAAVCEKLEALGVLDPEDDGDPS